MEHAAPLRHPARRDHDRRRLRRGQLLRLLGIGDDAEPLGAEDAHLALLHRLAAPDVGGMGRGRVVRRLVVALLRPHLRIELVHALRVARERGRRHRAVHENREHRDPLLRLQALHPVEELLDAADRERRDDQLAAPLRGVVDDLRESVAVVVLLVNAIAIRRFDEQVVRLGHRRRIRQHRPAEPSEIAAEEDGPPVHAHPHVRRAEQVPGVDEVDLDACRHRHRPVVADRLQLRHGAKRIHLGVERQRRLVFRVVVAVRLRRVFLLQPPRVGQDDLDQVLRALGAEHAAAEALRHQPGQVAAVIEVRVRQHHRLDTRRPDRQVLPVPLAQLLQPLEEPGVHQHARAIRLDQVLRARDRPRRTQKRDRNHICLCLLPV